MWARCGVSGFLYDFEIYTGKQPSQTLPGLRVLGNIVLRLAAGLPKHVGHKLYFDNLFTSIPHVKHLKADGIWSVGTIRANRMMGANKELMNEKQLKRSGRGAMDWRVDANRGITTIRWYDNGIVQLVSSHIGHDLGKPVQRWSAAEKDYNEIPCPAMVMEYNIHMGGVDLCDMLLSLYRVRLRICKYYKHIVYYCIGISVTNAWILYRRHCNQNCLPEKSQMDECKFQSQVAHSLLLSGKERSTGTRRRGRPSQDNAESDAKKRRFTLMPTNDIRYDRIGHFPIINNKQSRCRLFPKGYSHWSCSKCKIALSLVARRNCFTQYHEK